MSVQHCGAVVKSPFCPRCGAKVQELIPIEQLYAFLRAKVTAYSAKVASPPTARKGVDLTVEERAKIVEKVTRERDKFSSFLASIEHHVDGSNVPDAPLETETEDEV